MSSPFAGRWDVMVGVGSAAYPTWFELIEGPGGWTGSLVGIWGSARPISTIQVDGSTLTITLPTQYEGFAPEQTFVGALTDSFIQGSTNGPEGKILPWTAVRAPELPSRTVNWGAPIDLIAAGPEAWDARTPSTGNNWTFSDESLVNTATGSDLVTRQKFTDFHLTAVYSYPKGSNSGIYLRGRYEVQILDDHRQPPSVGSSGAVYGFLAPSENAVRRFGEENIAEITLIGRIVTIVLNGVVIHSELEIPGITGGALDSYEGEPGPLFIQGDHGPVTFHKLIITPAA